MHGENIKCFSTACGLTPRPAKTFKKLFIQTAFKYNFRQIQNKGGNSVKCKKGVGLKLTYFAAVASSYFALTSNNSDCTFSKARKEKRKSIKH